MMNRLIKQLITPVILVSGVTFLFIWGCSSEFNPCEYQFIVVDDSVDVFDGKRFVGTVELQGQLDSLITEDNK